MNLRQINELWNEYKEKYDLPKDVQISAVQYDAEKYVEGFFNILELLDGKYILHLNPRFHLYSDSYARFILFHEFTHFYDFINSSFDETEDLFIYMNAYSEFHACRVTLARFMERLTLKTVHIDKIQIPGPFNEISIRHLLEEGLWRVKVCFEQFLETLESVLSEIGFEITVVAPAEIEKKLQSKKNYIYYQTIVESSGFTRKINSFLSSSSG